MLDKFLSRDARNFRPSAIRAFARWINDPSVISFAGGSPNPATFPAEQFAEIAARVLRERPNIALQYGPTRGLARLCDFVAARCGVQPEQVILTTGSQQALDLIARVLIEPGDPVVIEDPLYQGTREVMRAAGARLHAVPVDRDGLDPAALPEKVRMAFVTPSHQYPSGGILPLARRQALLRWARRNRALVVEDDYDGEFRYDGKPLESLQGLDTEGRVLYVGTFSRTIFSALRIGYLVAPRSLLPALTAAKWLSDRHTPTLEQEALAEFIATGMYERHLRRLRRRNAASRRALLEALDEHLRGRVEITGDGAGAHVVIWPRRRISEEGVVAAAAARGVGIYGIGGYFWKRPSRPGIILGYPRLSEADIREGVRRLAEVL